MKPRAARYAIGLDFGTESARALLVDVADGREVAEAVHAYKLGRRGVIGGADPHQARQHPREWLDAIVATVPRVLAIARRRERGFSAQQVIGIGVDATGSTPLPVDRTGTPLALDRRFARQPDALAWLWKDHTSIAEAAEITELARATRPQVLARCGGAYSSEWFFSKILHCRRTNPRVSAAAYLWVECADWIPALLTGTQSPERLNIGVCAAGHKGMFAEEWGGYPDAEFLSKLDLALAKLRERLPSKAKTIESRAGELTHEWATKLGLPAGVPVSIGAIDAHLGAVGAGVAPGTLVKILGTSSCDMAVAAESMTPGEIPGLCGMVRGSIVPGCWGFEAGQAAVGDLFAWFIDGMLGGGASHERLSREAAKLRPGESGLLALDWNNGNRSVLADQRLSGLLVGQTLHTRPHEVYRALIEASAMGALIIIRRFEEHGLAVREVVACGGIAEKSGLAMQIYADVLGRPMRLARSRQTCALGAAIAGAVAGGAYRGVREAQRRMTGMRREVYRPQRSASAVYRELFALYQSLHDAFGLAGFDGSLHPVMKRLFEIRRRVAK